MNVLFCASEAAPFAASGGLGDVAGSLPRAIRNRKVACRVVMPLYGDMKQEYREKLTYITNFTVPVGWRNQYCGLFELTHNGVKYYFLDNEYYFKRTGLYGFYDDGERFAFFSRAILEMLFHVDFVPDVIHANDWQTALVPVYLNLYYRHLEQYRSIKTVFTIHNIQYQGKYGMEILEDTLAIGRQDAHLVEYDGCVNFMKGAIECADKVTTVSPSYAGEILDPWYSHGLDDLLRHKGVDLVRHVAQDIVNSGLQLVVLGSGEAAYESFFSELAARNPGAVGVKIAFVPSLARKIYAGADMFLMPSKSEPCGLSQMVALRYGTIPLVRETGGLRDSIHDSGDGWGNGFTFRSYNAHDMLNAVLRAKTGYEYPDGWQQLVKRAMECDFSWSASAKQYVEMYEQVCQLW